METLTEALRLLPPVIMSVRDELGVATDHDAYLQVLEQSRTVMQTRMAEFMENAKEIDPDN